MEERRRESDRQLDILTERVSNLIVSTEKSEETSLEWRGRFCKKLDVMLDKIDNLPCDARCEETKAIHTDIGWIQKIIWTILVLGIPAIITLSGVAASDHNLLMRNTSKWETLESERVAESKDIKDLKEKSYGYRNIKVVTDGEHSRV